MFLVPIDPQSHELEWRNVFEMSSLREWADERNKKMEEIGINHRYYCDERKVEYCDESGRLIKSYHLCQKNPFRLD